MRSCSSDLLHSRKLTRRAAVQVAVLPFVGLCCGAGSVAAENTTRTTRRATTPAPSSDAAAAAPLRRTGVPATSPLATAVGLAERGEAAASALAGYGAHLVKRESIAGELMRAELELKVRHQPFAVYLEYITPHEGRQVLYRSARADGKMLVRQTGLAAMLGTLPVSPTDPRALQENRHPVTSAGLQNLASRVADEWAKAARNGEPARVQRYPRARFADYTCTAVEVTHSQPGPHARSYRTRLFLDQRTGLPVRLQRFDFPTAGQEPPLLEDYAYTQLDLKTRLSDRDFQPATYGM